MWGKNNEIKKKISQNLRNFHRNLKIIYLIITALTYLKSIKLKSLVMEPLSFYLNLVMGFLLKQLL